MKFISLFAGIGGFDLGLERAGMECVAQVEIDKFCLKVLHKHWPNVPKFEDVRNVGRENLPAADLICGGFPCQPHSYAGKRKGAADDRDLWPEMLRVVKELHPSYVLCENVAGIRSTIFKRVLLDLEGESYGTESFLLPALAFGAFHRRDRIFIIAYAKSEGLQKRWNERQKKNDENNNKKESRINNRLNGCDWRTSKPQLCRAPHGLPGRVDRLRALGNAVVPQVVEFIGRAIMDVENATSLT